MGEFREHSAQTRRAATPQSIHFSIVVDLYDALSDRLPVDVEPDNKDAHHRNW